MANQNILHHHHHDHNHFDFEQADIIIIITAINDLFEFVSPILNGFLVAIVCLSPYHTSTDNDDDEKKIDFDLFVWLSFFLLLLSLLLFDS